MVPPPSDPLVLLRKFLEVDWLDSCSCNGSTMPANPTPNPHPAASPSQGQHCLLDSPGFLCPLCKGFVLSS